MSGTPFDPEVIRRYQEVSVRIQRVFPQALDGIDLKDVLAAFEHLGLARRLQQVIRAEVIAALQRQPLFEAQGPENPVLPIMNLPRGRSASRSGNTAPHAIGARLRDARLNCARFNSPSMREVVRKINEKQLFPDGQLDYVSYSQWESGSRSLFLTTNDMKRTQFFADLYGVNVMWLIYGTGEIPPDHGRETADERT